MPGAAAPGSGLASLLQRPACPRHVPPPTTQCRDGHLACGARGPQLTRCPACRGPLTAVRSLAMEKVADLALFPCRHASSGCGATMPPAEKADHEEHCEFRPCSCPCPGTACAWQGSMDAVVPHLRQHYNNSTLTLQGEVVVFLAVNVNLAGTLDWVMVQSCFGFQFILVLEKLEIHEGHQKFSAAVQLIGTREQAEHFTYRLELNGNGRRLMWEARPLSIHERIETAFMNSDCLVFYPGVAELFAEDGDLSIDVTISVS